jgi:fibrillarin-like rRNA methylase
MSLTDLLPSLRDLDKVDKLKAVQFLVNELAREEDILMHTDETYPIWSPYNSYDAADILLKALNVEDKYA